ncbi:6-phosphogluconolactonase [Actinotalea sp. K2]|uniref:6-phosphogluconolactonase n=1 Tax=Actinotalea sp. K2 TaxID=2939438 RepID=UPI002017A592|nr:6-phosphogluconolactonase [Actinotalea sp. K2]MCL3862029.1 6-phosphogluconolactonase [Actinotalea sp. K2]
MSAGARVAVVHPDRETLARVTAARLLVHLVDRQSLHRPVHVALTGGSVGIAVLAEIAGSPLRPAVDWTGVHLWWGDERFLPDGHPDRNETQAREALLDELEIPAANVHPMVGPGPGVSTPEESAAAYASELAQHAPEGAAVPALDVVLLGMGPDGHVASLFPGHAGLQVTDRAVAGVHGSPKPPSERVTLTLPTLTAAREIWLVVGGADKAAPAARGLAGDAVTTTPAAGAVGVERTLWLLDADAAG